MSRPLMLMDPIPKVVVTMGAELGVGVEFLSFSLNFLVYCCLCITGLYVSLEIILFVLAFLLLALFVPIRLLLVLDPPVELVSIIG
jgi:hypothetical protein